MEFAANILFFLFFGIFVVWFGYIIRALNSDSPFERELNSVGILPAVQLVVCIIAILAMVKFLLYEFGVFTYQPFQYRLDKLLISLGDDLECYTNAGLREMMPLTSNTDLAWLQNTSPCALYTPRQNIQFARSLGWTCDDLVANQCDMYFEKVLCETIGPSLTPVSAEVFQQVWGCDLFRVALLHLPITDRTDAIRSLTNNWKAKCEPTGLAKCERVIKAEDGIFWFRILLDMREKRPPYTGPLPPCGFLLHLDAVKLRCSGELLAKATLQDRCSDDTVIVEMK